MKPFDLELAKAGHPVCTRDGRKVRIICFDRENTKFPIVALVQYVDGERVNTFTNEGKYSQVVDCNVEVDLFMASEKKEGWINIYQCGVSYPIYKSEKEAQNSMVNGIGLGKYITTIKIEWEE